MIENIYLVPPLAFARVGQSSTPCPSFMWGPSDISPRGSGITSLVPAETLNIDANGTITSTTPKILLFRDDEGIRPVCPFFELHADWIDATGKTRNGPVTQNLLGEWGCVLSDVRWTIEIGNLKAFHYTYDLGDRIKASVEIGAEDHKVTSIIGASPAQAPIKLITLERGLPLGAIQAARPSRKFSGIRLRVYPPKGLIYGPEDLPARIEEIDFDFEIENERPNAEWRGFTLPKDKLIVNPQAHWPRYVSDAGTLGPFFQDDYRNTPGGLLAAPFVSIPWIAGNPVQQRSLGLVDDVGDGIVTCRLQVGARQIKAIARIVIGPPDFAPANRTPVSLADNLTDREDRYGVRGANALSKRELGELVLDILERAFETSELMHRDYQNFRSVRTNQFTLTDLGSRSPFDDDDLRSMLWPVPDPKIIIEGRLSAMTLSETGTRKHRRHAALEYLEDRFRENPELFEKWIRRPVDPNPFFDRRMPALMRGSDGRPFHLTRRQWEIIRAWMAKLRTDATAAAAGR